jgi:nitrogenase-associated protein
MNPLIFYEKPGCIGNQRQQAMLRDQGIPFETKDLLSEVWTAETLRPFFGDKPVAAWFNTSAPKVKSGEIAIHTLTEQEALELMIQEPLLVCRPLLHYDDNRQSGFTAGPVLDALNVHLIPQKDLQSCPMDSRNKECTP